MDGSSDAIAWLYDKAKAEFEAPNYLTKTSSEIEWWFVVDGSGKGLQRLGRAAWPSCL